MIFEPETCLYVNLIPKPKIYEKKFLNFSKWRIFSNSLLFFWQTAFLQISADFVTRFENFFVYQVVPEIYAKNTSFEIS